MTATGNSLSGFLKRLLPRRVSHLVRSQEAMKDNITKQCPICKLQDQKVLSVQDYGDKTTFDCVRCGRYTISGTVEHIAKGRNISPALSGWLRERNLYGIEIPMLTSYFLEEVIKTLPRYSPSEKQNKLLKAVEKLTDYPGKDVILIPEHEVSLSWAENENEFRGSNRDGSIYFG